jgi:cyclophilin family peptidyl-prolyl cis-trans isomerase
MSFVILGMASIYISREAVKNTAVQVHIMEKMQLRVGGKVRDTAKELYAMQREADALMKLIQPDEPSRQNGFANSVKSFRAMHDMKVLETKVTREKAQVSQLIQKIQFTSLIEVRKKYGHDPIEVEMELLFPDGADGPNHFMIELVPTELLPHTVLTFLDMVSSGLLNGCSFILNAHHAIKAAPIPYDGSSAITKAEAFTKAGLDGVVFREYSHLYPHKKNTVGIAVDGSPAFFINTADNEDIHDDEPCFGVITSGFDTIKRLDAMPTRNNIWFEKKVGIKRAWIIESRHVKR